MPIKLLSTQLSLSLSLSAHALALVGCANSCSAKALIFRSQEMDTPPLLIEHLSFDDEDDTFKWKGLIDELK